MLVKTINRSALLSWSPKFDKNYIVACGTAHFSNESNAKLEFFDLSQEEPSELLSISVPSR